MNYLAHAVLSFDDPPVVVGNLVSDFIKGRSQYDYPQEIQRGIRLHRAIDTFTDEHAVTREAMQFFRPVYRLYSGAFVDVVYDHFLALSSEFNPESKLQVFALRVYETVSRYENLLPPVFARMFPHMRTENWLYNYRSRWGVEMSFGGIRRRARYITDTTAALDIFDRHYEELGSCFQRFYPDLLEFARKKYVEESGIEGSGDPRFKN